MSIVLEQLTKHYGGHPVVNHVSLEVADGELFVLLGPSGSGKSTVLRMISGLVDIDVGRVSLHGRDVTRLPPQRRGVGFVFQHYALFRHMSVAQNIEFPLRIRRAPAVERKRRRDELLELVGLVGLERRLPAQLSGGQQQRVALARALAHRPEVLLLDEPFGALDARIRADLRRTLRAIQRELGVTTIFVTHDQEEAFELADRMGVMNFGRLLEVGPPDELYLRPQTEFVATFLGKANLMVGESTPAGVRLGPVRFPMSTRPEPDAGTRRVQILFRPEDVAVKTSPEALEWPLLGQAVVDEVGFSGFFEKLRLRLPRLEGVRPIAPPVPFGADHIVIEASRSQHQARRFPLHAGNAAWVGVRRVHALTHPGLSFLLVTDGSAGSKASLAVGGELARHAHARVTVLAPGLVGGRAEEVLQTAREALGSGLAALELRASPDTGYDAIAEEAARQPFDLVVHARPPRGAVEVAQRILDAGEHHLLMVPAPRTTLRRVLVCVSVGEPGKEDVLFAGRLVRHLGAEATILTVLPESPPAWFREQGERFLAAGLRTLGLLGIRAKTAVRYGRAKEAILAEIGEEDHDLVVLGAPLAGRQGRIALDGVVADLLADLKDRPLLIVRSHQEFA